MFQITPSSEFATWFEGLAPELAEEVACALDLLAEAGVALGPSRTSRALLWYDGVGGGEPTDAWYRMHAGGEARPSFDDVREVLLWHREIVRCLESTAFHERLARLEPQAAGLALAAVENLKVRLKAALTRSTLRASSTFPRSALATLATLTAREARVLAARFAPENELKEPFFQVLRLVGIEPTQMMNSPSGLCELTIPSTTPPLRVLFGLDAPGQRIVALVGEPLTRNYYGDSVQLAEQRWLSYCSSPAQPSEQAEER